MHKCFSRDWKTFYVLSGAYVCVCVFVQAAVLCSAALKAQGSAKLTLCLSTPELLNTFAEASGNKLKGPISAAICRRVEQRGGSGGLCWFPQLDLQLLLFFDLLLLLQTDACYLFIQQRTKHIREPAMLCCVCSVSVWEPKRLRLRIN